MNKKTLYVVLASIFLIALGFTFIPVLAQGIMPDTLPVAVIEEFYDVYLYLLPETTIDSWGISSGSLPPGLTLRKHDPYRAVISGTPSTLGTYRFTVRAYKKIDPKPLIVYKEYTINVVEPLDISPRFLKQDAFETYFYTESLYVRGGIPPYSWNVTGLLTGTTNITWRLSPGRTDQIDIFGTPPTRSRGNYSIEVAVRDSSGLSTSRRYLLRIKEIPWTFSVTIRQLTEEGYVHRAIVYLDELVFNQTGLRDPRTGLSYINQTLFEVTVRRISGIGNKSVGLELIALPGEIAPPGITMSCSFWRGLVGDEPFVSIISIKIDSRYPYMSEERDLRLILRTRVTGVRDDNKTIATTLKGIEADIRVFAHPVQVLHNVTTLVMGKSTTFNVHTVIICNRQPKINRDIELDVQLTLPRAEWDWELPRVSWLVRVLRVFGRRDLGISLGPVTYIIRTDGGCISFNTTHLPIVRPGDDVIVGRAGDPSIGWYWTAAYPVSMPRPKTSRVTFTVIVDTMGRVREINEYNNRFDSTATVVRTKPIRILFYPWAEDATERMNALAERTERDFIRQVLIPGAAEQVDFTQAVFPTAEGGIRYNIDPTIRIRGLFENCSSQPANCNCGNPRDRACRDWCNCANRIVWDDFLSVLERMADDAGYDFAIAFRVVGRGGTTRCGRSAYVDVHCCTACLAHELYHAIGPMHYDNYTCHQCPRGYWVNRGEPIASGRCYIMSACGGAPWWITPTMYYTLMSGWFRNPSSEGSMAIRVSGTIHRNGTGSLYPFRVRNVSRIVAPGLPGNYSIVLLDSRGAELSRFGLNATFWASSEMHTDTYGFMFYVPFSEDVHVVELRDSKGRVLDRRVSSANRPRVSILAPKSGEIVSSLRRSFTVSWKGEDKDGDTLYYTILISPDGGASWLPMDIDLTGNSITWDPSVYDASKNYVVKVIASDGFYSAESISSPFTIGPYVQLKVESPYGEIQGSGWYMINETATFSITSTQVKMDGLLGILGGYHEFAGWSGDSTSTSSTSTILMDGDKTVIAMFKPNYTMPALYLVVIVIVLLLVLIVILRKRRKHIMLPSTPPPPS